MGGGETMATILAGNDAATGRNVWDRAMFMSPFFRAPNIQGWAARVVGASLPEFDAGWGESCKINQLRAENDRNRRAGTCDFDAGNIRILDQYSSQAAARAGEVAIPIQIMAVDNDGSADDDATIRMFNQLATPADRKGLCFFCEGVQHAMLYDGDFYPENRDNRWWAPTAQDNLVNFIVDGSPVPLDPEGISQEKGENVCYLPAELRTRCKKYLRK